MKGQFDFIIVGGGAAAFAASTRANELGAKTAMINAGLPLGGTCINVGCIPTKHLLELGNLIYYGQHHEFGSLKFGPARFDFPKAILEKNILLDELRKANYTDVLENQPHTKLFEGYGRFVNEHEIEVNGQHLRGEKILIATGSSLSIVSIDGLDTVEYLTNQAILELEKLPASLIVIGAGPLGLEFAQMFTHFGTKVTVIEVANQILPLSDPTISRELHRCLTNEGIEILTNVKTQRIWREGKVKRANVMINGKSHNLKAEHILLATGVIGNIDNLGLEEVGVETDGGSYIRVDEFYQTNLDYIYAAGDVIGSPFLEAVAAKEGYLATGNALNNEKRTINYLEVPYAVFTSPQVAGVGVSEKEYLKRYGTCYCRTVYMNQVPKALAVKKTRGVIKMTIHHETDKIMGVEIVAPLAADMIHEAALAIKFDLTIDDIIDTVHVFPIFSEAIKLVAQAYTRDISKMSCCIN